MRSRKETLVKNIVVDMYAKFVLIVEAEDVSLRYELNIGRIDCISREPDVRKTDWLGPIGRPLEAYAPS